MEASGSQSKSVLSRLRVVWLNLSFWTFFSVVTLCFAIGAPIYCYAFNLVLRDRRRTLRLIRRTIGRYGGIIIRCGWPLVRVRFEDFGPNDKPPFVFVANHRSSSDPFLLAVMRLECIQVMNIWPSRVPLIGCFSRAAGYLRVREMPFEEFVEKGSQLLAEGVSLIAFPEGTRSGSGRMNQFHGSAFRLAQTAGATICPIVISGNENIPHRGSLVMHPGRITISKLPALTSEDYKDMSPYVLKTRVREMIQGHLDQQPAQMGA